jgi:DNA-binding Xre family transcriptional regulator
MPGPWGQAVRHLLADKHKTQKWLSNKSGLAENTVSKIVHGQHVHTRNLQRIADAFGVPIHDVLLQSSSLHGDFRSAKNSTKGAALESGDSLPSNPSEAIVALQIQVDALQQQLAEMATDRGRRERSRQRVPTTRPGQSVGARDARKSRS